MTERQIYSQKINGQEAYKKKRDGKIDKQLDRQMVRQLDKWKER